MTYFIIFLLVILFLIFSYWGLPLPNKQNTNYIPPDFNSLSEKVKPLNIKGEKKIGILLIHGFEGSSYEMKELGNYLNCMGYAINIPLLPGHGTSVEELVKTDFNTWFNHVEREYFKLRSEYNKVFVIGLSLGGLLAIKLAEKHEVAALITISAPVFFNGFYNGRWIVTDFRMFFSGLIALVYKKMKIKRQKSNNDICPWEGYEEHIALNCAHSIKMSMAIIRKNLYKINNPVCVIQAKNDFTVPIENAYYIYRNVSSIEKRAFSFYIPNELSTNHVLTTHTLAKDRVFTYILQFIRDYEEGFNLSPHKLLGIKGYFKHKYYKWRTGMKRIG